MKHNTENLYNSEHKTSNPASRKGYDNIRWDRGRSDKKKSLKESIQEQEKPVYGHFH